MKYFLFSYTVFVHTCMFLQCILSVKAFIVCVWTCRCLSAQRRRAAICDWPGAPALHMDSPKPPFLGLKCVAWENETDHYSCSAKTETERETLTFSRRHRDSFERREHPEASDSSCLCSPLIDEALPKCFSLQISGSLSALCMLIADTTLPGAVPVARSLPLCWFHRLMSPRLRMSRGPPKGSQWEWRAAPHLQAAAF